MQFVVAFKVLPIAHFTLMQKVVGYECNHSYIIYTHNYYYRESTDTDNLHDVLVLPCKLGTI